jgi:hypothetical protein
VNKSLDVTESDEHALLDFALHLSPLFSVCPEPIIPSKHSSTAHAFFPERLSNHCQSLRLTFPEIFTNFGVFLCRIDREIASGQIRDFK